MSLPKFQVEDLVYHQEKDIYMMVDSFELKPKGFLYKLKTMIPTHSERKGVEDEWKSYYEEKLERECKKIARKSTTNTLYARTQK